MTYRLDPTRRREDLAQLSRDDLDVLVVGGGVVGAGVALDAVSRGLRVGLVNAVTGAQGPPATPR